MLATASHDLIRDLRSAFGIDFGASESPMWVFDQKTLAFLAVNESALEVYGFSREEFLAMTILDIRPEEDIPEVLRHALRPHEVNQQRERWRHRTKSGAILPVEITGVGLLFEGRLAQWVTVSRRQREASAHRLLCR